MPSCGNHKQAFHLNYAKLLSPMSLQVMTFQDSDRVAVVEAQKTT